MPPQNCQSRRTLGSPLNSPCSPVAARRHCPAQRRALAMAARVPSLAAVSLLLLLQPFPALAMGWKGIATTRALPRGAPSTNHAPNAASRGPGGGVASVPDGAGGLYMVWSDE